MKVTACILAFRWGHIRFASFGDQICVLFSRPIYILLYIILIVSSILTSNPLIEEPGITILHRDNIPYNNIITYKNCEVSIINVVKFIYNKSEDNNLEEFSIFYSVIKDTFENKIPMK